MLTLPLVDVFYDGLRRPWKKDKEPHLLVRQQGPEPVEIEASTLPPPLLSLMLLPGPEAPSLLETTLRFLPPETSPGIRGRLTAAPAMGSLGEDEDGCKVCLARGS